MKNKINNYDFLIVGAGLIGAIAALALFQKKFKVLVIDKDNKAKWKYDSISNVPSEWLDRHTDVAWDKNPLEDL